jgi:hypothetical protein
LASACARSLGWVAGKLRKATCLHASESILDVMYADLGPVGEDPDHVEAQGFELWSSGVEVVFGYGADGALLVVGDGFQGISVAGPAPQLYLDEDEGVVFAHYQVDFSAPGSVVAFDE